MRLADPLLQLDEDPPAQRVVDAPQELELLLVLGERVRVAPLSAAMWPRRMCAPTITMPGAPGEEGLLQLDGAPRGRLGAREVAQLAPRSGRAGGRSSPRWG